MTMNESTGVVSSPSTESPVTPQENVTSQGSVNDNVQQSTTTTTPASQPSQEFSYESDQNPYRYAYAQAMQRMQQQEQAQQYGQLQQQYQQMVQQGYTPQQANQEMQLRVRSMQLQQQQQQLDQQSRPVAAQLMAQKLKQAYGVDITPDELMTASNGAQIGSAEAMLARADAIITERRKGNYAERVKSGADKVEKSSGTTGVDSERLKKMSPTQILSEGIRRMKDK